MIFSPAASRSASTRESELVISGRGRARHKAAMSETGENTRRVWERFSSYETAHRSRAPLPCAIRSGGGPGGVLPLMGVAFPRGLPSHELATSSYASCMTVAGAPVQLSEFEIAVDLEMFGPLTNSRNVSDLVHAGSSSMVRTSSWARNSPRGQLLAVGVAVLIELHPLHGFVVKRKRPGVGAWVTC